MPTSICKPVKSGDVAERSPAVFSANLKEDILLEKQVHVLNRSERSVVHRIKVEQKVMYRYKNEPRHVISNNVAF